MRAHYDDIHQLGGEVLVVSFSRPDQVAVYLARNPLPFPVVADPARAAYKTFDLGRTSWGAMLLPWVLARYLKLLVKTRLPRQPYEGDDVFQLGGDFVLDSQRRLVYAHPSVDPTDRPPAADLVKIIRTTVKKKNC